LWIYFSHIQKKILDKYLHISNIAYNLCVEDYQRYLKMKKQNNKEKEKNLNQLRIYIDTHERNL
jgi:hypothetical protein